MNNPKAADRDMVSSLDRLLGPGTNGHQRIPVNMYEATDALVVVAPMPGVSPDDVSVTLVGYELTLMASLRTAAPKEYLLHEWEYGLYERIVEIPPGFGGSVTATLGHGQLAVRITRGEVPLDQEISVAPSIPVVSGTAI